MFRIEKSQVQRFNASFCTFSPYEFDGVQFLTDGGKGCVVPVNSYGISTIKYFNRFRCFRMKPDDQWMPDQMNRNTDQNEQNEGEG